MAKKTKRKKKSKASRYILSFGLVLVSGLAIYSGVHELITTAEINQDIRENKEKSSELDSKKAELEKTKENLTNPDYIEYVARGKYLVTKDGEQVFKFSDSHN